MIRLILRKLGLIILLSPILHALGFFYAQQHPRFSRSRLGEDEERLSYFDYLSDILTAGEWGHVGTAPLESIMIERIGNSLILVFFAITITAVGGIFLGMFSVSNKTGEIRPWIFYLTSAGASLPGFLLGGMVIAFAVYQILYGTLIDSFPFPLSGTGIDNHLILPMLVLAVRPLLHLGKLIMGLLQDQLQLEYIRTARSKGARPWRVAWRHALPNMWPPIIAVLGQSLRFIVGGLLIAETMFSWPGIGQLFVYSIIANENTSGLFSFIANPYLIAILFVVVGVILLTADLIASVATRALSPQLSHE